MEDEILPVWAQLARTAVLGTWEYYFQVTGLTLQTCSDDSEPILH